MLRSLTFASLVLIASQAHAQFGGNCYWEVKGGQWTLLRYTKECPDCFNGSGCLKPTDKPWREGMFRFTNCIGPYQQSPAIPPKKRRGQ
jgi:hypothetical protein